MAKGDSDDIGKPGKLPRKPRRFPWRLWLYAIVMTAGAGAGGYYTYQFRKADKQDAADLAVCKENTKDRDSLKKQLDTCATKLGEESKRADGYAALSSSMTKDAQARPADGASAAGHADASTLAAIDDIQKSLARSIETHKLTATARRGAFVLTIPSDGLFAAGTADLTDAGKVWVLEVGFTLKRYADRRFEVTGHTDDTAAKPPFKDNWELSVQRSLSVTRALIQAGVDAKDLVAAGAGDADPLADKAKSARIEIALLPAASELPALPATLGADTAKPAGAQAPGTP
ncbi:MAG TPA: OmpA family protein, partial [Kofleriaceae bacterium]|nr:OmpA family protein [Kofleriaceae bacterium]